VLLTADPDADLEGNLAAWRTYRRRKRTADIHWIDLLYPAYVTALFGLIAVIGVSGAIGDVPVTADELSTILDVGPGWVGGLAAVALAVGLRSGSRGGPLALERAEVRQVLLAPVDRATALLAPAGRRLRFLLFVGVVVGGIAGNLAVRRLPGNEVAWIAVGALLATTLVGLAYGSALTASGTRLPRWVATLGGVVLIGWALADAVDVVGWSPTASFGHMALWPLEFRPDGIVPFVVAVAVVVVGCRLLGRTSLEAAERRSTIVGQLRFAATMQDLRTVIVLRRQLAMELPRMRPWVRLPFRGTGRFPIELRGVRGVLRWPAARIARLLLLSTIAGLSLRAVWGGTTPMVVVAGLAMFVAGLDAIEPLSQELDHPSRRDSSPLPASLIHVRHVPVGLVVMILTAGVAAVVTVVPGLGVVPGDVALSLFVPLALGGVGGALVSTIGGQPSAGNPDAWMATPPEAQGMRLAFRTAWPPAIAVIGAMPIVLARNALERGDPASIGAQTLWLPILLLFTLIVAWVRFRDQIHAWFKEASESAVQQRKERAGMTEASDT
jgi:hypothetical protein